ncbi:Ig-like domain-containing protein [Photobacterium damselae]|uniref:Ig-like domain-containing protein n=1 Tax=Photobacterium damselae TaxID=38293 RepID=UPI00159F714A|nr:Ig-like domain-containing protein [Photobacterium damselae]NVO60805.1 Ig-like domain-containing protein [Photobacterium damselae subsp. damselae]
MMNKLLLFIFALLIFGCGGGGDDSGNEKKPIIDDVKAPLVQSKVSQVNTFDEDMKISLKKNIKDPQGLPLSLVSVKALTDGCSDPIFDKENLTFYVEKADRNYCAYQYTVKNNSDNVKNDKKSSSISYVVMSETGEHSILDPLSASTTVGDTLSINLKDELGAIFTDKFTLQDDVYILGSGTVTVDSANSVINYKSDTAGITRLMYSIHNSEKNETMIGYIDVAVSDVGNTMPEADDFLGPENLALNTDITIDVAPYIRDHDGDPLQLTDVYVYNDEADVAVVSKTDVTNSQFTFSASKAGVYDITYIVYDHRNGFAIGIVRIKVEGPALPWHDITLLSDGERYTAPLDKNMADLYHVYYQSIGDYNLDSIDYEIPKFSYTSAETLCLSRGMLLPTSEQLIKLSDSLEDDVINELTKWPTIDKFWTSDKGSLAGKHLAFLFDSKLVSEDEDISPYIVTCVAPGVLSLEVTRDGSCTTTSIDSKVCYDEVTATVLHNDVPSENESVYLYSNDQSLFLNKTQGYTDVNGQVVFQIRSKDEGDHRVYISYYSQRLEQLLNFVLDTIEKYEVTPSSPHINVGSSLDLSSKITKLSLLEEIVTAKTDWKIIDGTDIVSLSNNTVKGIMKGSASIEGTYFDSVEGKSFTDLSIITVDDPFEIIRTSLDPKSKNINIGDEYDLQFNARLNNDDLIRLYDEASWSVDNSDIATVDNKGHVIGKGIGVATFTVYPKKQPDDPSLVKTATVTVADVISSVELTPKDSTIDVGGTLQMILKAHYKSGKEENVSPDRVEWMSKSPSIATINANGIITGNAEGTTLISGAFDGMSDTSNITVKSEAKSLDIVGPNTIEIDFSLPENTIQLDSIYNGSSNVTKDSAWSSSDTTLAIVDNNGVVHVKGNGVVSISASYNGLVATHEITITVKDSDFNLHGYLTITGCAKGVPGYVPHLSSTPIPLPTYRSGGSHECSKGLWPNKKTFKANNIRNNESFSASGSIITTFVVDAGSKDKLQKVYASGNADDVNWFPIDHETGGRLMGIKCISSGMGKMKSESGYILNINCQ